MLIAFLFVVKKALVQDLTTSARKMVFGHSLVSLHFIMGEIFLHPYVTFSLTPEREFKSEQAFN